MDGTRLARTSLVLDAWYCLVVGAAVALSAPWTQQGVGVPGWVMAGVGLGTTGWGGFLLWFSGRTSVSNSTQLVMCANAVASSALVGVGIVGSTTLLSLAAFALAVDVAAFAVSQGLALRLMTRAAPRLPG